MFNVRQLYKLKWGLIFFNFNYIIYATTKNIATNQNQNKIRCYFKCMHIVINANQRNVILDKKKKVWSDIKV